MCTNLFRLMVINIGCIFIFMVIKNSQFDNLSGISKEIVYPIIECLIFPHDPLSPPRVNKARSRLPGLSAHERGGQNRSFV